MNRYILPFLTSLLLLNACTSPYGETDLSLPGDTYAEFQHVYWLSGNWLMENEEGITTEHWVIKNDSTMKGKSAFRIGKDTISSEEMVLQQRQGVISFHPLVMGQNQNKAVMFTMIEMTDSSIVFENAGHDFPQRIAYTRVRKDSLFAEISGKQGGKEKRIGFPYKRVELLP